MTSKPDYSALQIALHWAVAILVVAAWFTHEGMGRLLHQRLDGTYAGGLPLHSMIGLSVLALVLVRLAARLVRGGPDAADGTPQRLALARHWGHVVLYALLVLIPLGGAAAWFLGLGEVGEIHDLVANLLMILAGGHAALALWHQYARHDGTLMRMLRP